MTFSTNEDQGQGRYHGPAFLFQNFTLHTLIHTFSLEAKLPYLALCPTYPELVVCFSSLTPETRHLKPRFFNLQSKICNPQSQ